ncbi:MAG: EAL domain-containing protein [Campylobacterota bacterium]|nr:EAL domain-containing protein [Campylobacterota bacterium]
MNKKLVSTTSILWTFVLFITIIFAYLIHLNRYIEKFSTYSKTVAELNIVNKEFDNFLLQKSTFINYDTVNRTILKYETNIKFLDSQDSKDMFPELYHEELQNVIDNFEIKINSIEYFKSENSQLLYSLHYLFDLNNLILKSENLTQKTIAISNETLLYVMKYYINGDINTNDIDKNLNYLTSHAKQNIPIEMFIKHIKLNVDRIEKFNNIAKLQDENKTETSLKKLFKLLNSDYQKKIFIETMMISILFIITFILLLVLIIMNKRTLKMQDELLGFKTAIENSYNSIVITDIDSNIVYVNDIAIKDTGYTREELIGENPRVLKSGLQEDIFYKEMHQALDNGKKWEGEFINKKKDGSLFYEKASIMPLFHDNELVNYIAIKSNITDYVQEKDKVEHMAYHDSLTSLPNRLRLERYLRNRFSIAKRNKTKIALLFIDLDRFKIINDTLGHDVGDELLIESAKRMNNALRESDLLARVGGDEFAIVLESLTNDYSAGYVCENILKLFSKPIQTSKHTLNITLSIGVAIYPDDAIEYNRLLKYSDIAMYEAKNSGKNTYRYYQKELSVDVHNHLNMEQALKSAIDNNEIFMMYQPQYNLDDKTVVGLEALVRWNSSTLGVVPPDKFIPVAEDTGYIIALGLYIFELTCRDFLEFKKSSPALKSISINISTVQLYQDSFIEDILKITKNIGIEHEDIMLEITETHIMKNIHQSIRLFNELKKLGFKISIDDFGTGHSSLSYLKLFPIDELKIDKAFVDDLPHDNSSIAITKAILTLSKSMGYINVAEGIEYETQEKFLKENDCKIGQGYHFCRPKIRDELLDFLS